MFLCFFCCILLICTIGVKRVNSKEEDFLFSLGDIGHCTFVPSNYYVQDDLVYSTSGIDPSETNNTLGARHLSFL